MTDSPQVSKRFETPIKDSLKPMHQRLVEHYAVLLDKRAAAIAAGYVDNNGQLDDKVKELFTNPRIIAAIDEFLASKLDQLDSGRAAICERLLNQSLCTIFDVARVEPYVNGTGKAIPGKTTLVPIPFDEVEPRFRCALSFIQRNQDGTYAWDNVSQQRAIKQLASLMMWDQSILNTDPPLIFNFGTVQSTPYEAPSDGVELDVVSSKKDEIDTLTQH